MKRIKRLMIALLPALALAGCAQDDNGRTDGPATGNEVRFTATVGGNAPAQADTRAADAGSHRTVAPMGAQTPATRTTTDDNTAWVAGDRVGVWMLEENGDVAEAEDILAANTPYGIADNAAAASGALTPTEDATALAYPGGSTDAYDFAAYYPHGTAGTEAGQVDGAVYNISVADQSDPAKLDVLWDRAGGKTSGDAVAFAFRHTMSRITLNVRAGGDLTPADIAALASADVRISGMPSAAKLDLNSGTLSGMVASEFSPLKTAAADGFDATFSAIIVPQPDGGAGRRVAFTVGGKTLVWEIPDEDDFDAGLHYTYPLTLSGKAVEAPHDPSLAAFAAAHPERMTVESNDYTLTTSTTLTAPLVVGDGETLTLNSMLTIGPGGSLDGDAATIAADGSCVLFNVTTAATYSGTISGPGTINKMGVGTLTLTGANTLTGHTTISAGTLALSGGGSLEGSTVMLENAGCTFDISGIDGMIARVAGFTNNGKLVTGGKTLIAGGEPYVDLESPAVEGSLVTISDTNLPARIISTIATLFATGNTVTVTGSMTGVSERLQIPLTSGERLIWKAEFKGSVPSNGLLRAYGGGTFEVAEGADIANSGSGYAVAVGNTHFEMSGGTIANTSDRGPALDLANFDGTFLSKITGGTVTAKAINPGDKVINFYGGLAVTGGKVFTTGVSSGNAIHTESGNASLTVGGTAEVTSLHGHTVYSPATVTVEGSAKLTTTGTGDTIHSGTGGKVYVKGGTVSHPGQMDGQAIYSNGTLALNPNTVEISGGTVTSDVENRETVYGVRCNITISGGKIEATGKLSRAVLLDGCGTTTVSGGTIEALNLGIAIDVQQTQHYDTSLYITGGTLSAGGGVTVNLRNSSPTYPSTATITGGTINNTIDDSKTYAVFCGDGGSKIYLKRPPAVIVNVVGQGQVKNLNVEWID